MRDSIPTRRPLVPKLSVIVLTVSLGLLCAVRVFAAADPTDAEAVGSGAQLYELYCSDCHGSESAGRPDELYDSDEMDAADDYDELVEIVRGVKTPERYAEPEDDWPEWAENEAPEREPDMKREVLGSMSRAIDTVNATSPGTDTPGNGSERAHAGYAGAFEPAPGATNLADPATFFYGTSEQELFNSIANGTGAAMPGWRAELGSDDEVWDLVSYILSLWGEEWQ